MVRDKFAADLVWGHVHRVVVLFAHLLPMDNSALLVRCIAEWTAAVGVHVLVHLEVEKRLIVVDIRQLLRQRTGVGGEDAGELLLAGHPQNLVLHKVHAGDVLAGIQLLGGAHHERVQDLVETLGQVVIPVEGSK